VLPRLALIATLIVAGCGGNDDPQPAPTTTPAPASTVSGANAFIGSIAVDPGDGTVMLGTGLGLFRLANGADKAERVVGKLQGGQVSSNLVVRYAGPGELLASGHPEGGALPENLGIIRSRDQGNTWEPVSELGESDYHILQVNGDRIVGVKANADTINVNGETRTPPDTPLDVAFDPEDPNRMVVATKQGTFTSSDEGRSWRPRDAVATEQLAWGKPDALYRADPGGLIKVSADGGRTWKDAGSVGLPVNELAVDKDGTLYASVAGGEIKRSTDGGASWSRLVKLR
jgi:photosystem II stability/assembly factor-like uncharacterized protein